VPENGASPVRLIRARTLPEGWEASVADCWRHGLPFRTEYDKPGDPPSKDAAMIVDIAEPLAEPRIHRAFPDSLEKLEAYRQEVLHGVHDHWINPAEGKWQYTYHERLCAYEVPGVGVFDQIERALERLVRVPYSRRAQAVTWKVWLDLDAEDPACLQRLWFRLDEGDRLRLHVHIRSNDAFKAAFMNMYAFTELLRAAAETLSARIGRPVTVGRYVHVADSYHIYGSYFDQFKGFLETLERRTFEERTWPTAFALPFFIEGLDALLAEEGMPADKRALLAADKARYQRLIDGS
jgi:thymidylate synthase